MRRNQNKTSVGGAMVLLIALLNAIVLEQAVTQDEKWYSMLFVTIPLFLVSAIGTGKKVSKHDHQPTSIDRYSLKQ